MPAATFRLTGSVTGFPDSALVSVMVHVTPNAPNSPAPSMAREHLCWAPWTGPTNGRRVSRVMSYLCTSPTRSAVPRRCFELPAKSRRYPFRRSLTWSAAFRARLRIGRAPSPRRPGRGPGATWHPWGQGGHHPGLNPRVAGRPAHARGGAAVPKLKDGGAGVIEREDIWGRSVAPRLADWAGRPPGRRRVPTCAAAGAAS